MPWIIGSTVVFVPTILYLLRPKEDHGHRHGHGDDHAHTHHEKDAHDEHKATETSEPASITDDEGTEVSGEEVNASMQQSFESNSPKDAQAAEVADAPVEK